jgi:hypothetical protein
VITPVKQYNNRSRTTTVSFLLSSSETFAVNPCHLAESLFPQLTISALDPTAKFNTPKRTMALVRPSTPRTATPVNKQPNAAPNVFIA